VFPPAHTLTGDVPPARSAVIARATAFAPEDRFAAAAEMRDALHAALDDRPAAAVISHPPAIPTPAIPTPAIPTPAIPTPTAAIPTPAIPTPAIPTPAIPTPASPATDPSLWSQVARVSAAPALRGELASVFETRPASVASTPDATGKSAGTGVATIIGGVAFAGLLAGLIYWSVTSVPPSAPVSSPTGSPLVAMRAAVLDTSPRLA